MSNRIEIKCDGVCIKWFPERGFGFIKTGFGNIYTHAKQLIDRDELKIGDKVSCKVGMSERGQIAREVKVHA